MRVIKRILKSLLLIAAAILIVCVCGIGYLSLTEYKPSGIEEISASSGSKTVVAGSSIRLATWNIGYCGLDKNSDFFMDGGKMVRASSKSSVESNEAAIAAVLNQIDADIYLIQEVDLNSARTYYVNEMEFLQSALGMDGSFAYNYKCEYVPYPLPQTLGKIESGILTMSDYSSSSASRIQLPVPFSWPMRIANLKRCLLVERYSVEGSDKELVIVNLHLEAYDDGEGKKQQTEMLAAFLDDEYKKGNYVIAGGDFNQTFPSVSADKYPVINPDLWHPSALDSTVLPDGFSFAVDDSFPTCRLLNQPYDPSNAATQYYVIDGFIVSDNIRIDSVKVRNIGFENSDHQPVVLDVTLIDNTTDGD